MALLISDELAAMPEVQDIELYAGTAAPINFNGLVRHYDLRSGPHVADLQVNLVHKSARDTQSHPIARRIRPRVQEIAKRHGAAVKVVEVPPGPPVLSTLVAEIYGPNEKQRVAAAAEIREVFSTTDGVVDVDWFVEDSQPKRIFRVDREKSGASRRRRRPGGTDIAFGPQRRDRRAAPPRRGSRAGRNSSGAATRRALLDRRAWRANAWHPEPAACCRSRSSSGSRRRCASRAVTART